MNHPDDIQPPRWAQEFLRWYCRPDLLEDLEGDLHEYFLRNLASKGKRRAQFIYLIDVIKFLRLYTIRKPQPAASMNNLIVLRNYFKTSVRTIYRNKLFSGINIVGLAIAMSVGLLLVAFLAELKSYDTFHANYDRIYRVTNTLQNASHEASEFASTSVLTGKKMQEEVASGIESMTLIRAYFDKDVKAGEKTIPMNGIWADTGFFKVFTWDLLAGDPTTALQELNSLVLTEKSAVNLFGSPDVVGKQVLIDTVNYTITAVMKDPPTNSHLRFDMIGSFITLDTKKLSDKDKDWMKWDNMWVNYVYLVVAPGHNAASLEASLARISNEGNKTLEHDAISLHLQPLGEVVLGPDLSNQIGPNLSIRIVWILGGLALIVIVSACFNYTNLSIARALRRTREVGIRKVVGASRQNVFTQFLLESVMISLMSLVFAYLLFLLIRPGFISMDRLFNDLVFLRPTPSIIGYFFLMALAVGLLAGLLPALFFSNIQTAQVLKDLSGIKLFKHLTLRKSLIIFQYTLSILLIVGVSLGTRQYQYALAFDLGLTTKNIINVELQGNQPGIVMHAMSQLPEVKQLSRSMYVPSTGTSWSGNIRYKDPADSALVFYNYVDSAYLRVHDIPLLAGRTFIPGPTGNIKEAGIIINQKALGWMGIKDPREAIGEEIFLDGEKLTIIGVVRNFHHSTVHNPIGNFILRYYGELPGRWGGVLNLKVESKDLPALMANLETIWKRIDAVHPLKADFFEEKIRKAYDELAGMMKIIGFLAFLAISIASLGLLGMVVFTTETRLKEISIRKVMGASEGNLVVLMSRGFLILLVIAALVAIPSAYYVFDQLIFSRMAFRAPIGLMDLFGGTLIVMGIAVIAIASQTLRVARVNPATTLRNE
ncbi:MAG: ABC transporter permease [Cyclobacteriaceae bacterium]|nr:ABC transporter permease [Cyclobacteriaceae bacterium]